MRMDPLPGPIGIQIKQRLESATLRCEPKSWEDLYAYIIQDQEWQYDNDIVRMWRTEITTHFLERCKVYHDKEAIQDYEAALHDGLPEMDPASKTEDEAEDSPSEGDGLTARSLKLAEVGTSPKSLASWANLKRSRTHLQETIPAKMFDPRG
jgi:hypothetical protein